MGAPVAVPFFSGMQPVVVPFFSGMQFLNIPQIFSWGEAEWLGVFWVL